VKAVVEPSRGLRQAFIVTRQAPETGNKRKERQSVCFRMIQECLWRSFVSY